MASSRLSHSFLGDNKDLTVEERRKALVAKKQLSKGDDESTVIIGGYEILDVDIIDSISFLGTFSRLFGQTDCLLFGDTRINAADYPEYEKHTFCSGSQHFHFS